jgi:Rad3-related DNA helicase
MEPLARIEGRDGVMKISKPFGSPASEPSEVDIEGNIRELSRGGAVFRQGENKESEMSAEFGRALQRVSGNSRREIDTLVGELQTLRDKLETDSRRLQKEISEYASLNQQVMQLTKIISESLRKLPDTPKPVSESPALIPSTA